MTDLPKYLLVHVIWDDSETQDAWQHLCDYQLAEGILIHSVGFLIMESDTSIAIAPNLAAHQQDPTACSIIRIPKSAVREFYRIEFMPERKARK